MASVTRGRGASVGTPSRAVVRSCNRFPRCPAASETALNADGPRPPGGRGRGPVDAGRKDYLLCECFVEWRFFFVLRCFLVCLVDFFVALGVAEATGATT